MPAMKVKDADILIVPGYTNSGPGHWQTRWQSRLSTARRVEQAEWAKPERSAWTARIAEAVNQAERPVVLVAHSLPRGERCSSTPARPAISTREPATAPGPKVLWCSPSSCPDWRAEPHLPARPAFAAEITAAEPRAIALCSEAIAWKRYPIAA